MPGLHWIVAPSYRQVKQIVWTRLKQLLRVDDVWKFNEQELSAYHPHRDTKIELKGADNEDSLRGVGLRSLGVDEAAMIKPNVWPEILRPMLADSQGPALFISTPKGRNWFYDLFIKDDPDWQSFQHTTSVNKYISETEIQEMKKDMSERLYKQEVLAEFLDEDTGVFKRISSCAVGKKQYPVEGRLYYIGVDLAKTEDFTVLCVMDSVTRNLVRMDRFQNVSWKEQKLRIQQLAEQYNNAICWVDSTGLGDPIYEDLQNAGVAVEGFKFTNQSKKQLVEQLAIAIEQRLITFFPYDELIDELRNFSYTLTDKGNVRYEAPPGKHDDCVISLGLAVWGLRSEMVQAQVYNDYIEGEPQDRQGHGELVTTIEEYDFTGY